MKYSLLVLIGILISLISYAEPGKITLKEYNHRGLFLNAHKIPEFFEPFFSDVVSKWSGGISPIEKYGLKMVVGVPTSSRAYTNAHFVRGGITATLGSDVTSKNAEKILYGMISHELGHVVFEKFSGLVGYSESAILGNLIGYQHSKERERLVLAMNELFADVFSLYVTKVVDNDVLGRGYLFDFSKEVSISNTDLDIQDPYHFFLPSRKAIYERYLSSKGDYDDLGRYYYLFVETLLEIADSEDIKNLDDLDTVGKLNKKLAEKVKKLSSVSMQKHYRKSDGSISE